MYPVQDEYTDEREFIVSLARYLAGRKLHAEGEFHEFGEMETSIEQSIPGRRAQPDITVHLSEPVELKHQPLSNPFFIECKLGREHGGQKMTAQRQVMENYCQFLNYKYGQESETRKSVEKYGEYDVVVAAPHFLTHEYDVRDASSGWISPFQLQRTIWHLGLGMLYRRPSLKGADPEEIIEFGFGAARIGE